MTADQERAAVVAWLRSHKIGVAPIRVVRTVRISQSQAMLANAIERGDHLKGQTDGNA